MATPQTLNVSKMPAVAGQPQSYQFYYLVPATAADGSTISIRQVVITLTKEQLQAQLDKANSMLALITANP
jgi:hypothetical protein